MLLSLRELPKTHTLKNTRRRTLLGEHQTPPVVPPKSRVIRDIGVPHWFLSQESLSRSPLGVAPYMYVIEVSNEASVTWRAKILARLDSDEGAPNF